MNKLFASLLFIFITQIAFADNVICDVSYKGYKAIYEPNKYDCAPGYFLPANTLGCVVCPDGFVCPGGAFEFNPEFFHGVDVLSITDNVMNNACAANFSDAMFAIYEPNIHDCEPGYYLPANVDACSQCPNGYYCPGGTYTFNEYTDQGLSPCPDEFNKSDGGVSADIYCYTDCKLSDFEYALGIDGRDYYGTGVDTCVVTDCRSGYHVENGMCATNTININWNQGYGENSIMSTKCSYDEYIILPDDPVKPGYTFTGWKVVSE